MKKYNISKTEILEELFSKNRLGIKPGLDRTLALSNSVGNPHLSFKSVHIAGTNGKGSVCSSIASILMECGYKTGLYTSPHLVNFNERIRVNFGLIPDEKLIEYYIQLKDKSEETGATFFEITTVMAFMYFAESEIDIAVIETGMGGRFDSTNIINPLLSIITKIDFDHQEYLGDTIQKIASEKAGIIKHGKPIIIGKNSQLVYDIIHIESLNNKLIFADLELELSVSDINSELLTKWALNPPYNHIGSISFPIPGQCQKDNLKVVIAAISLLKEHYVIENDSIIMGFRNIVKNTGLRARVEQLRKDPLIILDGSHNPGSIENLFSTLSLVFPNKKWNIIFSIMGDKDNSAAFENINKYSKSLTLPQLKTPRALSNQKIMDIAIEMGIKNIKTTNNVSDALDLLKNDTDILIFGSFFLAAEVIEEFEMDNR